MFDRYDGSVDHPDARELVWLGVLGVMIGGVSGVCAIIFRMLIALFHNLTFSGTFSFYYDVTEYTAPSPWGVGIIVIPMAGALAVSLLVRNFAPGARSHGVTEVMESIYYSKAKISPVLAVIKTLTSAISIGTGGSIGREGPIIQITATVGSMIGGWMSLPGRVRTVLLAAAAAGGVGASFDAPLGGIFFSIELFLPAVSAAALLPVTLSAVVATVIARQVSGGSPVLALPPLEVFDNAELWRMIPALLAVGIAAGMVATLFVRGLCDSGKWFGLLSPNYYIRHSFGMLLVGVEIWFFLKFTGGYYVEGLGYSTIFTLLRNDTFPVAMLLLLLAGKYLATCLTLGSGGSGGVFCPSLFLGAVLGALLAHAMRLIPGGGFLPPELLVLAGMAAVVGGTTGAALSGIMMVAEQTGRYELLPLLAVPVIVALAVRRTLIGGGIYTQKLIRRGRSIPEGLQSSIWSSRRASDLMVPLPEPPPDFKNWIQVDETMDMDAVLREWRDLGADAVLVLRDGEPAGVIRDRELGEGCRAMAERML